MISLSKLPYIMQFWAMRKSKLTNHSLWPSKLSSLRCFTTTLTPGPSLLAADECSSIHPLKTGPRAPSPRKHSARKFLVAILSSASVKFFKFGDCKMSSSLRGVGGTEAKETLLVLFWSFPSGLIYVQIHQTHKFYSNSSMLVLVSENKQEKKH